MNEIGEEWFWRIVDANGPSNLPSDESEALRMLVDRSARLTALEALEKRLREWLDLNGEKCLSLFRRSELLAILNGDAE